MTTIKAIDFFCGAGGLTRGLLDAGIAVLAGVDSDARLRDTYEKNNEPAQFVHSDISKVDIVKLRTGLEIGARDRVVYAACTPCQPFSTLNQKRGADPRKSLLLEFMRLVGVAPPDYIIVENVPGLNNAYGKEINAQFQAALEAAGFAYKAGGLLDAKDYGVPQIRQRYILLASKHAPVHLPRKARRIRTVRDAIGKYPKLEAGESSTRYANHEARKLTEHHRRLLEAVPKDGGSRSDVEDTDLLLKCHREKPKVHKDVFGRMWWDQPAPTLTCRCTDVYCGRFVHPQQDRGLSLREAAALQTFADRYRFHGKSIFQMAGQIGNAVPVRLARSLGQSILASERLAERA